MAETLKDNSWIYVIFIEFGDREFNENIMGDDENLRDKFISASIYLENKN